MREKNILKNLFIKTYSINYHLESHLSRYRFLRARFVHLTFTGESVFLASAQKAALLVELNLFW